MLAACHLLGPTWKGADLGPNRGAFLSIRHALQWAPWHLLEETETPSGGPRESAPGVCSLAPCALRCAPQVSGCPRWSFQSQKQSRNHCPLGTDPPQVGAARACLPGGPGQGSGGALGTHRLSVQPRGSSSPSVTEGPRCTQAPPDLGPLVFPYVARSGIQCQIRSEGSGSDLCAWSPCDSLTLHVLMRDADRGSKGYFLCVFKNFDNEPGIRFSTRRHARVLFFLMSGY